MATVVEDKPAVKVFPKNEVVTALSAELLSLAELEAQTRGIAVASDHAALSKTAVPLDSLSVVDILCAIEPIVGVELRESIVRTGGYSSVEDALNHLVPRIERVWLRKKETKK